MSPLTEIGSYSGVLAWQVEEVELWNERATVVLTGAADERREFVDLPASFAREAFALVGERASDDIVRRLALAPRLPR